jgi:ABC-type polysaccharide/polyol phosphate export permease
MLNILLRPILEAVPENNRLERIWVMAKTDFLKRYYGSFLGVIWALINPAFQIIVYYTVFTMVFSSKQENFALFLFLGLLIDMYFTETSNFGLNIIRGKRHVLENIKIAKLDIYYAATLSTFFAFAFNFGVYLIVSFFAGGEFHEFSLLTAPLLLANLVVFSFAMQILLATIQIFMRDIVHLWDMAKLMILWLSGVFYAIDPSPGSQTEILAYLTPLAGIIYNSREVLLYGNDLNWEIFAYDWIYTLALLATSIFIFYKFSAKALEKI